MAFPERSLHDGEDIEVELHPHWRRAAGPILWLLALTVAGGTAIGVLVPALPLGTYEDEAGLAVIAALLLVALVLVLPPLLRWRATSYVLTDRRLVARSGVVNRSVRDLPLSGIRSVALEQRGLDRVMRSGDLVVYTVDGPPMRLAAVPGVHGLHARLQELAGAHQWHGWQPPARQPWERYS